MAIPLFHARADPGPLAVSGPYGLEDLHLHVFPLIADSARLQQICDKYLNVPDPHITYEPVGFGGQSAVFLITASYGEMNSASDDVGVWDQHELLFLVPVQGTTVKDGTKSLAVMTPFVFVDEPAAMVTGRENYGWPKMRGRFRGSLHEALFTMDTDVVDEVGTKEVFRLKRLVQLTHHSCFTLASSSADAPRTFEEHVNQLLQGERGYFKNEESVLFGKTLSLFDLTISCVNLKQFRDETTANTRGACYQSIVSSPLTVDFNSNFEVHAEPFCNWFRLEIYRRGSMAIVNDMGLLVTGGYTALGGTHVDVLEPLFPFHITLDLTMGLGQRICWRGIDTTNDWKF